MFTLFHIADVHLGARQYGLEERRADVGRVLLAAGREALAHRANIVVVSGDIFDGPTALPDDMHTLMAFLDPLHKAGVKVVLIEGDHDSSTKAKRGELGWPAVLQEKYPQTVITEKWDDELDLPCVQDVDIGGEAPVRVCPIDWKPAPRIREVVKSLPAGVCDVLVMHQSLDTDLHEYAEPELNLADVMALEVPYTAMGDIHARNHHTSDRGHVVAYPGALEWHRSYESDTAYGSLVTIDRAEPKVEVRPVQLPSRPRLEITVAEGDFDDPEALQGVITGAYEQRVHGEPAPLVFLDFPARMADRLPELTAAAERTFEGTIVRTRRIVEIDEPGAQEATMRGQMTGGANMHHILTDMTEERRDLRPLALQCWENPGDVATLLDAHFQQQG